MNKNSSFNPIYLENQEKSNTSHSCLLQSFSSNDILVATDYPESYGGTYVNSNGNLVILVVGDVNKAKAEFSERTNNESIIIQSSNYTFKELTETMDALNLYKQENKDSKSAGNFNYFAIIDAKNRIEVALKEYSQDRINEFKEAVSNASCITFVESKGDLISHTNVNPGAQIIANLELTVGYRARRNSINGIVTAAHGTTNLSQLLFNGTTIGTVDTRMFSGAVDATFFKITKSGYTPTNDIPGVGSLETVVSQPAAWSTVYMFGATTGKPTNGSIESTNVSATYGGVNLSNLTSAYYASQSGDSGGCVYRYGTNNKIETCGINVAYIPQAGLAFYCKASAINLSLLIERY